MRFETNSQARRPASRRQHPIVSIGRPQPVTQEPAPARLYRIQVAGKLFQGHDLRALLRLAVAAKRNHAPA